jgi:1,4-dihydroxy-6-naphthoate synthase
MEEHVMKKHIELYVNDFTVDLKEEGRKAIEQLYSVYLQQKGGTAKTQELFN